jgi:exoribonuclease R
MSATPCKTLYKININDRNYSSWTIFAADSLEPVSFDFDFSPCDQHLFTGDIFTISNGITCKTVETNIIHSSIRTIDNIPAVLILANNKTYGRKNGLKGKLLYKCIPDDMRIPAFLVPYEIKQIGFSKVFTNLYVTIRFTEWTNKHPVATISQNIGSIDILDNYYEYQLYCKSLNSSIQKFTKDATKALDSYRSDLTDTNSSNNTNNSKHDDFIEKICKKHPQIENRTNFDEWRIFTIDPRGSLDYDDAFSIKNVSHNTVLVSIYIANVTIWMDFLNLWSSFSQRISTIYLPDQKRPMLPTILSDCLCSLQSNATRVAFVMDILIDTTTGAAAAATNSSYKVISTTYSNCIIKVFRNFVYEEPALIKNTDYNFLLDTSKQLIKQYRYIPSVRNSHELVSYLMVFMNFHCAKELLAKRVGIFRTTIVSTQEVCSSVINEDVCKFIKIWNSSCGQYINISASLEKDSETNLKHELLEMDAYVHITSPIRRLVDLLNIIQLQHVTGLINLSDNALQFYDKWISQIDYINVTMRAIRKVQTDCLLLDKCYNKPEILEVEYEGYCFDKLTRNDGLYQFIVFLPELKIASRITTRENMTNFEKRMYKLFLFKNEERFRTKIRLQLI